MRIVVTGATGFVGRAVLDELHRRGTGIEPVGVARRRPAALRTGEAFLAADLRDPDAAATVLRGADVVIHAAAGPTGSPRWSDGVGMFANVLAAASAASTSRVVLVSSLSVIDYTAVTPGQTIDENSPLIGDRTDRDAYARAKAREEQLARQWTRGRVVIVRPGAIVGAGREWTPRLGVRLWHGRWIQIGRDAEVPIIRLESCAAAIANAALHPAPPTPVHLIDQTVPTQQEYIDGLVSRGALRRPVATISHARSRTLAGWASILPAFLRRRLPSVLVPSRHDARFGPYRFVAERMRALNSMT